MTRAGCHSRAAGAFLRTIMREPIKAGDLCEVIGGLGRTQSPNIGQQVTVVSLQGEHSQHGRIWRCTGPNIQQLTDAGAYIVTAWADFAADWLRKIEPPPAPAKTQQREVIAE